MNSPRTGKLWKWSALLFVGGLLLSCASLHAKADTSSAPPVSSKQDAIKFLRTVQMRDFYQTALDFKAENLTAQEVATRVEAALLARKPALPIRIEVRDVLPVKLSVGVRTSTVGRVLSSTATLAGARLWIFEEYALLAPEKSLTPEEQNSLNNGFGVSWPPPRSTGRGRIENLRRVALTHYVLNEINGAAAPYKETIGISVKQLSPAAQTMLQELVKERNQITTETLRFLSSPGENFIFIPFDLPPNTVARFSTEDEGALVLNYPTTYKYLTFPLDGRKGGFSVGIDALANPSTPPTKPRLPLDLSAGKS